MKKTISLILSFSLIFSIFNITVYAVENTTNEDDVEDFCEGLTEMVNDYTDSGFVTPDSSVIEETTAELGEETEINFCSRLIVQSDNKINTYNAIDVVSGFSNFYILQFENEKDTNYAYEQYSKDENIISVSYDVSYNALEAITESTTKATYNEYKNAWYLNNTGLNVVLEKYKNKKLPQIIIAVVDTGYDFNNIYFNDRIIKTNYNNTGEYDKNSEQDYGGHGTMVTSIIMNCSTDNVKVANYRVIKSDGTISSITLAAAGILKAINDGVNIINCSFSAFGADNLFNEVIKYAYESECTIFSSAGNENVDIERLYAHPLNTSEYTVTVGAHDKLHIPVAPSVKGKFIDVLAPGENVPVIHLNNIVGYANGTSFSAPFMAAVFAMYCTTQTLKPFSERFRIIKNSGDGTFEKYCTNYFGSGNINALKLFNFDTVKEPTFSHNEFKYDGPVSLELCTEEGAQIYYTTDGTYPTKTNGMLYTTPIKFENTEIRIRAIAYKDKEQSNCVTKTFVSTIIGTDDMFKITENGIITNYLGNIEYLTIPEKIQGITVLEINTSAFQSEILKAVVLPNSMEFLGGTFDYYNRVLMGDEQMEPFYDCNNLKYIWGNNIKVLGYYAADALSNLREVFFPNCEKIFPYAFYWSGLFGADFPNAKYVGNNAFNLCSYLREVYLPVCVKIGYGAFDFKPYDRESFGQLRVFYAPKANSITEFTAYGETEKFTEEAPGISANLLRSTGALTRVDLPNMTTLGDTFFGKSAVRYLELSNVKYLYDLPDIIPFENSSFYCQYYMPVSIELLLPSTLKYAISAQNHKYPEYNTFCVYGTKGTYAEEWAKENEINFIEITQETAIREDIEPIWDEWSYKPLEFDARGFNRTYQWYGYNKTKENAVAIKGATDRTFNPENYKQYEYYYCVMTSVDGDSVFTVKSGACHNKMYNMFAIKDTYIDYDNNLIYTQQTLQKNFDNILKIQDDTSYYVVPSYVYKKNSYYGTGSQFLIYSGGVYKETFTLIVQGDVNGDSVVDVLDLMSIELATNNHIELNSYYHTAADSNMDGEISVEDFSNIVNLIVTG